MARAVYPRDVPGAVFDPANPNLFGRFAAIALLTQAKEQLDNVRRTYGAGVYALYYTGDLSVYGGISGTETKSHSISASPQSAQSQTSSDGSIRPQVPMWK